MIGELEQTYLGLRSAAERTAASGRPVVGIVGRDVPALLVTAAGAQPFRISVEEENSDEAAAIMGRAVDQAATAVLAAVLSGSLDFLRGILIAHDSQGSVRLFYTLQELHRRGRTSTPVRMVDQVHLDRPSTLRYNITQLSQMWHTLAEWTSDEITFERLETARAQHTDVKAALFEVREARRRRRIPGITALHCYAVAAGAPTADAVSVVTRSAHAAGTNAAGFPVFLTGSAPIGDRLYRLVEDAGAIIVGEDHDWGDPIVSDRLPEHIPVGRDAVLRELALSRLRGAPAAATSSMAARARATRAGIEASGAGGLLSVVRTHDEAPLWDWRHQSLAAGIPTIQIRNEAADDPAQIIAAIETLRAAS